MKTADLAQLRFNQAVELAQTGNYEAAEEKLRLCLELAPNSAPALVNLSGVLLIQKKYLAAREIVSRALAVDPNRPELWLNLGLIEDEFVHDPLRALDCFDRALGLRPRFAEAHYNRANAMARLNRIPEAIDGYDKAIYLRPDYLDAYHNLGNALFESKRYEWAVRAFDKAIALDPTQADVFRNRGYALRELKQYPQAVQSFDRALRLNPELDYCFGARLYVKAQLCDWQDRESETNLLLEKIARGERCSHPFEILSVTSSLSVQREVAMRWVADKCPPSDALGTIARGAARDRIRIGYFSADFREHAIAHLVSGLIENHRREKFDVIGVSIGENTGDPMRKRLESAFDQLIDVGDKSDQDVALLARALQLDIAIDLTGHTANARTAIFAFRVAPIQLSYLGFLGTMGASYFDYILADHVLVPEESRQHFCEKIAYLPHYQVNDLRSIEVARGISRQELGIAQSAFVYCCFNTSYKLSPRVFDCWVRILNGVENSVLFLYAENDQIAAHLHEAARARGLVPERIIFGGRIALAEYFARLGVADLFLDTLPYAAGTTASDALWMALPVLTCTGESFASRIAASVLSSLDENELITSSLEEYVARAIELGKAPERCKRIRRKLEQARLESQVFDAAAFAASLENAYTQMVKRYDADLPPDHIIVEG